MPIIKRRLVRKAIASFVILCVLMMNMVFPVASAEAATALVDHHHAQAQVSPQHDCMHHDTGTHKGKAHADCCQNGACCQALSSDTVITPEMPQQHHLVSVFQPMLTGIVLPTDVRPPISFA